MRIVLTVLVSLAFCGRSHALEMTDVAGTIDREPVTVAEVDRAAGSVVIEAWRNLGTIARHAARGICTERIHRMLAESEAIDAQAWRARLWVSTAPESNPSSPTLGADPATRDPSPGAAASTHEAHVRAYRERLKSAAERISAHDLTYTSLSEPLESEPELPDVIATCLGRAIKREEVQAYAAYPLYQRRAELISTLCEQFEISYEKPLVVGRVAAAEGKTVEDLLAQIEGDLAEIPEEDVRRAAGERFGRVDDVTLLKARLALDAERREYRRRAWIEKVRHETYAECKLAMPAPPQTDVHVAGISSGPADALPIYYFGNFACTHCRAGWQMLRATHANHQGRVRIEFRHHFPDSDFALFSQAIEAECAARQRRFWEYGDWRTSKPPFGSVATALGLDAQELDRCMQDPAVAVDVLDDTAEALRLGFREAVPSWVVGTHSLRGVQGQREIDRAIEEEHGRNVGTSAAQEVPGERLEPAEPLEFPEDDPSERYEPNAPHQLPEEPLEFPEDPPHVIPDEHRAPRPPRQVPEDPPHVIPDEHAQ